jgi:hypothetical protein
MKKFLGDLPEKAVSEDNLQIEKKQPPMRQDSTSFENISSAVLNKKILQNNSFASLKKRINKSIPYCSIDLFKSKHPDHRGRFLLSQKAIEERLQTTIFPCAILFQIEGHRFFYIIDDSKNENLNIHRYKKAVKEVFDFTQQYKFQKPSVNTQSAEGRLQSNFYDSASVDNFLDRFFKDEGNLIFKSNYSKIKEKLADEFCRLANSEINLDAQKVKALHSLLGKNIFKHEDEKLVKSIINKVGIKDKDKNGLLEAWKKSPEPVIQNSFGAVVASKDAENQK